MRRVRIGILFLICLLTLCGCLAFKEGTQKVGQTIADAGYNTYQAIEKADQWFRDNYW